MHNRNAICLCVDRNMLVPALFVGNAIKERAVASPQGSDVIIFVPSEAAPTMGG